MEGSKEISEDQLDQMAERAIKESKSGVGELIKNTFVDLLRTTQARSPKEKKNIKSAKLSNISGLFKCLKECCSD